MAVDDDVFVVLKCIDRQEQADYNPPTQADDDEVMISTTDVYTWNFSSILQHRIIKVHAHRNRLIEHSTYFHGLLGGNFSDPDVDVLVQWNKLTFLCLLTSLFGSPVDVTSENFLSIFEGALYFGMEMILAKCKMWLTKTLSVYGDPLVQLNDLVSIWDFGSEFVNYLPELCASYIAKNFIWAMSCSSFGDVPYDLLLSSIKHPHLTIDSEKQLCDVLLAWIGANKERCTEDVCTNLLKQIRIRLLPLWFAAGKNTYQSMPMCSNGSFCGAITLLKQSFTHHMEAVGDDDLLNLRIRLTEFTQRVDLSGCPQIKPEILHLSMLPCSLILKSPLRKKVEQLFINHDRVGRNIFKFSCEIWSNFLTFEAVQEINISNCPMLHLEAVIECFSKSFPSLRTLKAANHISFRTTKILQMVKKCPLLCDIDFTVDVSPVIPTRVSILSSFAYFDSTGSLLTSNITKLTLEGRIDITGINMTTFSKLMSQAYMLKNLCLRETQVVDDSLFNFIGSSLEGLDVSNTKVSAAAVAHVIGRNPGLKSLKARGCDSLLQQESKSVGGKFPSINPYFELGKSCKLDEISVGWGFSYVSLETLKPAISLLKAFEVGLGGCLGLDGLKLLPAICPLLESVVLYFQVIADHLILNMLESLRYLNSFSLCHCLGETSSLSFKVGMPNLRKLRLERVAPWMNNDDLVSLNQNCANLIELSLLGCRLLNSESQKIISSGWPGLISIHLEECGEVTSNGVVSFFDCHALEDILLRHNGSGIQKGIIGDAVAKLPMLRKISLDICDAKDRDFDIPEFEDRHFLSYVKIARCKSRRCTFHQQHIRASRPRAHSETLVLVWDSKQLTRTIVKERL